jgi:hypothetical protein
VLIVVDSIYDGTWASGPPPEEFIEFELCYAMHWSTEDYARTPLYKRRVFWDCLQSRRRAEKEAQERRDRRKP